MVRRKVYCTRYGAGQSFKGKDSKTRRDGCGLDPEIVPQSLQLLSKVLVINKDPLTSQYPRELNDSRQVPEVGQADLNVVVVLSWFLLSCGENGCGSNLVANLL